MLDCCLVGIWARFSLSGAKNFICAGMQWEHSFEVEPCKEAALAIWHDLHCHFHCV